MSYIILLKLKYLGHIKSWHLRMTIYTRVKRKFRDLLPFFPRKMGVGKNDQPLKLFLADWYLSKNADVAAMGLNPLKHYRSHGWREGRWPNAIFDPCWYTKNNPDVERLGTDPLEHFERHGRFEGRRPSPSFDPVSYLRLNPDVAASGVEPAEHFLFHGFNEGRPTSGQEGNYGTFAGSGVEIVWGATLLPHAILSMRDATSQGEHVFTIDAASEAARTLAKHDDAGLDWRSRILAKMIYRVDEEFSPVPDGLSYAYINLAHSLNDGSAAGGNSAYDNRISLAEIDPIGATEALMQRELGYAIKLQTRLLNRRINRVQR